jgi:hypothetical protein
MFCQVRWLKCFRRLKMCGRELQGTAQNQPHKMSRAWQLRDWLGKAIHRQLCTSLCCKTWHLAFSTSSSNANGQTNRATRHFLLGPNPEKQVTMDEELNMGLFFEPGMGKPDLCELIKLSFDSNTDSDPLKQTSAKVGV